MPISKPALSIGGFAVVGFGGIAVAAWQVNANYTAHDFLTDKGYSRHIIFANMEPAKYNSKNGNLDYGGSYQCFSHFFPNTQRFVHDFDNEKIEISEQQEKLSIADPEEQGSKEPMGCTLMQLSYKYYWNQRDFKNFVFKSEITVKNDKVGWALWTIDEYTDNSEGIANSISYLLVFLENEDGVWKIKGGYNWKDKKIPNNRSYLYIASPDGVWLDATKDKPLPKQSFERRYSGLWEENKRGKGEIFREIMLGSNRENPSEVLGREDSDFVKSGTKTPYGYEALFYNFSGNKWTTYYGKNDHTSVSYDATEKINAWYKPFRGLKGKWRSFERYCNEESLLKGISEDDPRFSSLLEWCYRKEPNR